MTRSIMAVAFALAAIPSYAWWTPDAERYPVVGVYSPETHQAQHAVWIHGTEVRDRDRMAEIAKLFPPYMFDSTQEYMPGCCVGDPKSFGYIILVDGGEVTFVITENRANELSGSRMLAYVLLSELVRMWRNYGGYDSVIVSLSYVPAFKDMVVFAYGYTTDIGVKVVMSS